MSALKLLNRESVKKDQNVLNPHRSDLEKIAERGHAEDVDFLMSFLFKEQTFAYGKLIDFVLSLVTTVSGRKRIRFYLFHGNQIQRNYAALYLKRLGNQKRILKVAVERGCIDTDQAFSE